MQTTATLKNGLEVTVRSIRADDRERLVRAFHSLNRETVYTRFFRYVSELSEDDLNRAVETDPDRQVALVVTTGSGEGEAIVGGGRYILAPGHDAERVAEIAFTVEEDYQGLGIAGLVLRELIGIARGFGIARFVADVLPANGAMLRVFARSGLPMRQQREDGVIHVELSLSGKATANEAPPGARPTS